MIGIKIKPLSQNKAYTGRRYKTAAYKDFQEELLFSLPNIEIPDGKLFLKVEFGFSDKRSDITNPLKIFEDVLQKKYQFNDNRVYETHMKKKITKKGAEYILFSIEAIDDN